MGHPRKVKLRHRRAWWRLWRYCRCGHRWRCPDSAEMVPAPYLPPVPPSPVNFTGRELTGTERAETELTETERAEIRALSADVPARNRASNRRPGWDGRAGTHPRLTNGRTGNLTPAQEYRARQGERV